MGPKLTAPYTDMPGATDMETPFKKTVFFGIKQRESPIAHLEVLRGSQANQCLRQSEYLSPALHNVPDIYLRHLRSKLEKQRSSSCLYELDCFLGGGFIRSDPTCSRRAFTNQMMANERFAIEEKFQLRIGQEMQREGWSKGAWEEIELAIRNEERTKMAYEMERGIEGKNLLAGFSILYPRDGDMEDDEDDFDSDDTDHIYSHGDPPCIAPATTEEVTTTQDNSEAEQSTEPTERNIQPFIPIPAICDNSAIEQFRLIIEGNLNETFEDYYRKARATTSKQDKPNNAPKEGSRSYRIAIESPIRDDSVLASGATSISIPVQISPILANTSALTSSRDDQDGSRTTLSALLCTEQYITVDPNMVGSEVSSNSLSPPASLYHDKSTMMDWEPESQILSPARQRKAAYLSCLMRIRASVKAELEVEAERKADEKWLAERVRELAWAKVAVVIYLASLRMEMQKEGYKEANPENTAFVCNREFGKREVEFKGRLREEMDCSATKKGNLGHRVAITAQKAGEAGQWRAWSRKIDFKELDKLQGELELMKATRDKTRRSEMVKISKQVRDRHSKVTTSMTCAILNAYSVIFNSESDSNSPGGRMQVDRNGEMLKSSSQGRDLS